jgi:hypothetical protein
MRTIRELIQFLGIGEHVAAWNLNALKTTKGNLESLIMASVVLFVVVLGATWYLPYDAWEIKLPIALGASIIYGLAIVGLIRSANGLTTLGLLFEFDFLTSFSRSEVAEDPDNQRLRVKLGDKTLDMVAVQLAGKTLLFITLCEMSAMWFLVLIPYNTYGAAFPLAVLLGITWLLKSRPLGFKWFEETGSLAIYACSGVVAYMFVDYFGLHPHPWIPGVVTAIGTAFALRRTWWAAWSIGWTKGLALVVTLFLLIYPYIGFADGVVNTVQHENEVHQMQAETGNQFREEARRTLTAIELERRAIGSQIASTGTVTAAQTTRLEELASFEETLLSRSRTLPGVSVGKTQALVDRTWQQIPPEARWPAAFMLLGVLLVVGNPFKKKGN